jgi:nitrite reductase/ring-hydroxylating ferredoxin subunit
MTPFKSFIKRAISNRPIIHSRGLRPLAAEGGLAPPHTPPPSPLNDFFRHWHCIALSSSVVSGKPSVQNIGDLPLVLWRHPTTNAISATINICKHMGSRLDNAKITPKGCLKCQYHGFEYITTDTVGQIAEHEGKVFWSYKPHRPAPHSIPYYHNTEYETSHLQIDMDASLIDSALNTMDIRHPEYVHSLGFGSNNPPQNIKEYVYDNKLIPSVGLSFDYISNGVMRTLNDQVKTTQNFHMYVYPTFSWSHVKFSRKSLIIGVNLLPLAPDRTRWFITIVHNYYKSDIGKRFMQTLASTILNQDYKQMRNQAAESPLKREMMFDKVFDDEEAVVDLHRLFQNYRYPDMNSVLDLYREVQNTCDK